MKKRFNQLMDFIPLIDNRTKLTISFGLLVWAATHAFVYPDSYERTICLIAMAFCFIGDVALNCMPLNKRPHWLLYLGAFFFMIAHLVYAYAYYTLISNNSYEFFNPGAYMAIGFMVLILIAIFIFILKFNVSVKPVMLIVFGFYAVIIGINFVTICSYSWSAKAFSFVGALSFLISDLIIGIETIFKVKSDILRKMVWIFYPVGQIIMLTCR